jgi:NADH-quinone oxidoreductase subunit M
MERISRREVLIFAPLTILVLWFGIYPASLLDVMASSILVVLDNAASGGAMVIAGR